MENKNYYDWLEISKKASPEVIEKAYKALVKKYHPDLQEENKAEAEEFLKKINEAYDVLSDFKKRTQYDATLKSDSVSKEDYDKLKQELNNIKSAANYSQNIHQSNIKTPPDYTNYNTDIQSHQRATSLNQEELEYQRQLEFEQTQAEIQRQAELSELEYKIKIEEAKQKAYRDAYIQSLRNRGYKIRYKKSFKDYLKLVVAIIIIILAICIAWHIPFVHNWLVSLYNDNEIIKFFVNLFIQIINSIIGLFK